MKNQIAARHETRALTLIEVLGIIVIVVILAGLLVPVGTPKGKARRINCASNLKQIGIAFRIWADDHGDKYPQAFAGDASNPLLTNVKWPTTGTPQLHPDSPYTYLVFAAMSNELNTPKIVVCPLDNRRSRTNFSTDFIGPTGARNLGISYFAGRDASVANPAAFLAGDRNICADTSANPIPNHGYGISPDGSDQGAACAFPTNYHRSRNIGWSPETMHKGTGYVALADGSVQQFSTTALVQGFISPAGSGTNPVTQNYLLFP